MVLIWLLQRVSAEPCTESLYKISVTALVRDIVYALFEARVSAVYVPHILPTPSPILY